LQEIDERATFPIEPIIAKADEVVHSKQHVLASKQVEPLSEATSIQKNAPDTMVVFKDSLMLPLSTLLPPILFQKIKSKTL